MENLYTIKEVSERYRVRACTVRRWIREGKLTAYKLGGNGRFRIYESDLEKFEKEYRNWTTVPAHKL